MSVKSECSNVCMDFLTPAKCVTVCVHVFLPVHSLHAHTTRPESHPIQWILTTKKNGPMKYAWQEKKLPAFAHWNVLPPSLSERKTLMVAVLGGAAAESLHGALSFTRGGLASSHLILDFTRRTAGLRKSWAVLPQKKVFSWCDPALSSVCASVCLQGETWESSWYVRS